MITSLQNHLKSRRQDSLLYLDQSSLQTTNNVIRRYRQRPRRVLLLRAIEGLAVVTSNHPDYLLLARLEFKLHKCPDPCLTHPYHFFILLRVLSIFFRNIVSGLRYEEVHFYRLYSLTTCLTHPYHFFIPLRVLSIFFRNIISGLLYKEVHFYRLYSLTTYKRSNLTFCGVPSLAGSNPLPSVLTRWLWCRYLALPSVLAEPIVLAASSGRSLDRCLLQLFWKNSSSPDAQNPEVLEH